MSEWKLVPVEPTQEMLIKAFHDYMRYERQGPHKPPWNGRTMWRAMLAASPSPPASVVTEEMVDAGLEAAKKEFNKSPIHKREQIRAALIAALASRPASADDREVAALGHYQSVVDTAAHPQPDIARAIAYGEKTGDAAGMLMFLKGEETAELARVADGG